jgi:NAD(P)-dependent dehydrogenase (short-subunit alcohol dehydrogenase family)
MSDTNVSTAVRDPRVLFDLTGKAAVVTGASGAFGRAISIALAAMRCRLLLASGSADLLAEVAEESARCGAEVATIVQRPDSVESAEAIVAAAEAAYGTAELLIVASGYNRPAPIAEMTLSEWEAVMDANVRGAWLMAKAFGPRLIAQRRRGKVLFVSSVRGRHGSPAGQSAYCPSKGATDALTRALAAEWGPYGINVNAIAPTIFRSNLTAWIFADDERGRAARARNLARIPLGRLSEPEDLIGTSIYLLSPASDYCTGQVIYVDGGYTAV